MERRRFITASMSAAAGVLGGQAGARERTGDLYTGAALAFGTTVTVAVFHPRQRQAELAIDEALRTMQSVDRLMSIYNPHSQVFQLNRDGMLPNPDFHLLTVLRQARALSVQSKGAFDITVQPLWRAFNEAAASGARPLEAVRLGAASKVGWRAVKVTTREVVLEQPGMAVTLNGLAQGYAADLALAALRARKIEHALVDAGEFAADGSKPGPQPWSIGVADPRDRENIARTLRMDGRSVATSGDYATAFTPDFIHHHIFDPATGLSPPELSSVTVVAPSAMLADGLSTTCMVLGARRAHGLVARMPMVDLMTINKRGLLWKSPGFPASA
ncbi:MAG: FAD:protein FMN transferase [Pseudomonadota bacterium]